MFKALKPPGYKLPFCEISHLNADTIKFVVNLRAAGDDYNDWYNKLSPEERAVIDQNNRSRKGRVCNNNECKITNESYSVQLLEEAAIDRQILIAKNSIQQAIQTLENLNDSFNTLTNECTELQTRVELLQAKEKRELRDKEREINSIKNSLEHKITDAENELNLLDGSIESSNNENSNSSNNDGILPITKGLGPSQLDKLLSGLTFGKNVKSKKHSGIYQHTAIGKKLWSCCMFEEEDNEGCIDEQSIGVRSSLVVNNSQYYKQLQQLQKSIPPGSDTNNNHHHHQRQHQHNQHKSIRHNKGTFDSSGSKLLHTHSHTHSVDKRTSIQPKKDHGTEGDNHHHHHHHHHATNHISFAAAAASPAIGISNKNKSTSNMFGNSLQSYSTLKYSHIDGSSTFNTRPSSSVGKVRGDSSGDLSINRLGGRPLTASSGPHLTTIRMKSTIV